MGAALDLANPCPDYATRLGQRPAIMNRSEFFLGPDRDLASDELEALHKIKAGVALPHLTCHKLELENLVERRLGGWKLTPTGEHRLAAGK